MNWPKKYLRDKRTCPVVSGGACTWRRIRQNYFQNKPKGVHAATISIIPVPLAATIPFEYQCIEVRQQ